MANPLGALLDQLARLEQAVPELAARENERLSARIGELEGQCGELVAAAQRATELASSAANQSLRRTVERDEAEERAARAEAALRELVELKDGPRDDDYERRKPAAWQAARDVVDPS